MSDFYSRAKHVLVWLGQDDLHIEKTLRRFPIRSSDILLEEQPSSDFLGMSVHRATLRSEITTALFYLDFATCATFTIGYVAGYKNSDHLDTRRCFLATSIYRLRS